MFVSFAILLVLSLASTYHFPRQAHAGLITRGRFFGRATWYVPGHGACGSHANSKDYVVAINRHQYRRGKMCYKKIHIINTKNGKSISAKIIDECPSCAYGSLDMSPVVFGAIADSGLSEGRISIAWTFHGSHKRATDSYAFIPSMDSGNTSTMSTIRGLASSEEFGPEG